jgi:hypothetical protein
MIDARLSDRVRVSAEVGAGASIADLESVLGWLASIERIARAAVDRAPYAQLLHVAPDSSDAEIETAVRNRRHHWLQRANADRTARRRAEARIRDIDQAERALLHPMRVERLSFENPLEAVLGGAVCVLVYRIIIVVRDWKTEQRRRNARADGLEASALQAHQLAERHRLENRLIDELITQLSPDDPEKRAIAEQLLTQSIRKEIDVLAAPPQDVDAEIVPG